MMAIALCAMTVPVFAGSNNKSVKSAKYNAYATEYVGFVSAGSGNTYGYAAMDLKDLPMKFMLQINMDSCREDFPCRNLF